MDIDGVDMDDGAVAAAGGWRPSHAPAMLAMGGMPTLVGLKPGGMPVMRHAFETPLDATGLPGLAAFPAYPPSSSMARMMPTQEMMLMRQQQQQRLQAFPPAQQTFQKPQVSQQPVQPPPPPPAVRILPRTPVSEPARAPTAPVVEKSPSSAVVEKSPSSAVVEKSPSTPEVEMSPTSSVTEMTPSTPVTVKAEEVPEVVANAGVENQAGTPPKPDLTPESSEASTSPPKAPHTRATAAAKAANAIPTDVHEIIVRAKEFRLKAPKQPTKKLTESRATGERPLDVALAEARIITQNVYVQRKPRKWEEDEVPICSCKRPEAEDQMGCMEDCVNRAALIECLDGFCPCGDKCDNQRIQRGLMPVSEVINAGKKGLGIMARQFIKQGDFVAEYMGEIVTEQEYHLRRLRYHHEKHRYMMVLSGGEVIDATRMGGLARFINHSCEPNCGVEKWEVNGEERCGIFALRDINSGEELSFDYKFQSFSALEITTCLCGSANCRGYIGVNNKNGKHQRKGCASQAALPVEKGKPLDPITKQGRTSRKTLEAALERMYRALAGHKMFTRKEITMLLDSRLLLKRNIARHLEENLRLLCLEPYFVSEDGVFGDMQPMVSVRGLPEFPQRPEALPKAARQERLEVVLERLRTQQRE